MAGSLLLVGCGKMGGALLDGWLKAGTMDRIVVVEPSGVPPFARPPQVVTAAGPHDLPAGFVPDVVVLAVKPQVMDQVVPAYTGLVRPQTVFLSIAAGKPVGYFERRLGAGAAIVRAMPNTPAAVGRGITVCVANAAVAKPQADLCDALLRAVGDVAWIDDESWMDAVTAVSGSGPAYVFLLVEALAKAGEAAGLSPGLAQTLARATVSGSGELLRQSSAPAAQLREAVTSPNGTTQAALNVLMAPGALESLLIRAVAAATQRSRELAE
ncbi:MAG TPA: pyrroline-5-carboxylate reductase [Azospirillum sp.]